MVRTKRAALLHGQTTLTFAIVGALLPRVHPSLGTNLLQPRVCALQTAPAPNDEG